MQISQLDVDAFVENIVPDEYKPKAGFVLGVTAIPADDINKNYSTMHRGKSLPPGQQIFGLTVNASMIVSSPKLKKMLENKYFILVNKNQSLTQLMFTIAHEIGHVHDYVGNIVMKQKGVDVLHVNKNMSGEAKERRADEYARALLIEKFGAERAKKIFGSIMTEGE